MTQINEALINQLHREYPILALIEEAQEVAWINPNNKPWAHIQNSFPLTEEDVRDAEQRLMRFAPYLRKVFPECERTKGIIESPITVIPKMKTALEKRYSCKIPGTLLLKEDNSLPISGSIKARGGIYEVLSIAEKIAMENGLLQLRDDYSILAEEPFRKLFSQYSIAVGSTGNLGLSIGIMSAKLGFQVTVHMSADARQWKKDLLRSKGVTVVEYEADYSVAVKEGREQAKGNPMAHFVDDENSKLLFLGYAVAGIRVKQQLEEMKIPVDRDHPLFVFLPCGVGGGPGGVAFGLKSFLGEHVHVFFAEPTQSPCMLLGMLTGLHDKISVQDIGLSNKTVADGLAVGRASGFVGKLVEPFLSGCYSLQDETMLELLPILAETEQIRLEPSALAGMMGPVLLNQEDGLKSYLDKYDLNHKMNNAHYLVWATGGGMVPEEEMEKYLIS